MSRTAGAGLDRRTGPSALGWVGLLLVTARVLPLSAQQAEIERERAEFARWLAGAPTSPLAAVALAPVGQGIRVGPADAEIPIAAFPLHRVSERGGRVLLEGPDANRPLVRGRPVTVGRYTFVAGGLPGRATIAVHAALPARSAKAPTWYPYAPAASVVVTLEPPPRPATARVLAADGTEVEAAEGGTVSLTLAGWRATLTVRRMPGATPDESELEVYFRDGSNGKGTYPAGRFVALVPLGERRYRLDFNRARNPFCAYNSVYPCPAPWRGNLITAPIEAGERYGGAGLDPGPVREQGTGTREP